MKKTGVTIIPCVAGWYCLDPIHDAHDISGPIEEFLHEPIIGWRVETFDRDKGDLFDEATPVCATYVSSDALAIILRPDGIIMFSMDCHCENEAQAIDYYNRNYARTPKEEAPELKPN